MYLSKVVIAGPGAGIFTNFTRDYGIYFQTDRMLLVIFFFMLRSETHQKAVMFFCSQRKCLFQLPLRQSLKLNRLNFNFRLVFHSISASGKSDKNYLDNQKRLDSKGNIKRCRVPLIKEAEQIAWLQRKLGNAARVEDVHPISERPQYFSGDGKSGKIRNGLL
ncbi:type I-E CRISPR-associated protein Cas6/Cse3/CasE [Escherichia coli]